MLEVNEVVSETVGVCGILLLLGHELVSGRDSNGCELTLVRDRVRCGECGTWRSGRKTRRDAAETA